MFSHAAYLEIGSLKSGLENMKKSGYCKLQTLVVTLDVIFLIGLLCVEISTKPVNVFVTIIIEKQTIRGSDADKWDLVCVGITCTSTALVHTMCEWYVGHRGIRHTPQYTVDIASAATPIDPTIHPSIAT